MGYLTEPGIPQHQLTGLPPPLAQKQIQQGSEQAPPWTDAKNWSMLGQSPLKLEPVPVHCKLLLHPSSAVDTVNFIRSSYSLYFFNAECQILENKSNWRVWVAVEPSM